MPAEGLPLSGRAPPLGSRRGYGPLVSGVLHAGVAKCGISGTFAGTGRIRPSRTLPMVRPSHAVGSVPTRLAVTPTLSVNAPASLTSERVCTTTSSSSPHARQQSAQVTRLIQRYVQLLFSHPVPEQRGHLWLGHWSPPLRQALGPLLQGLTLCNGQAALLRLGTFVTQAYCALWDSYGEALSVATLPTPDIDFSEAPPPASPVDVTSTPNLESPPSQLQPPLDRSAGRRPRITQE